MAKKQKSTTARADNGLKNVSDYRFPEATRKNNPPAKIAAEGHVPLIPKAEYVYSPRRPPELRFQIARLIVDQLAVAGADAKDRRRRVLALQSRHQLFPQVFRYVDDYVRRKVNFQNCDPCELGLEKYVQRIVERLRDAIVPDESEGEAPLMPITNRYKPIGATAEVDFKTTRACHATMKSHIDQVVLDNLVWESSAGFRLESSDAVQFYARKRSHGVDDPVRVHGDRPRLRTGFPGAVE